MSERIGSVVALWRYPVKSMMGEELNASSVTDRGLVGDRGYALVDVATGKVASAKNPKVWAHLFDSHATFVEPPAGADALPPVRITLADGSEVRSDHPGADAALSKAFGRDVKLERTAPPKPVLEEYWPDMEDLTPHGHRDTVTAERMALAAPEGTFFDASALHVLATESLNRLRELYPQGRFEVRRFRPNVVVRTEGGAGFVDNEWAGRTLRLGAEVRAPALVPAPRCVMTTLPQGDLPKDSGILRTMARHNLVEVPVLGGRYPCLGVFATVEHGGTIARGDGVFID